MITNKAEVTGMTRLRFASTMRMAVSVAEPKPLSWTSRAGAIVPGTRNLYRQLLFFSIQKNCSKYYRCAASWANGFGRKFRLEKHNENYCIPPLNVSEANSYSATENPALLWAVTLKWYHEAGSKSSTTKFPPGLTLFETWVHSVCNLKYNTSRKRF